MKKSLTDSFNLEWLPSQTIFSAMGCISRILISHKIEPIYDRRARSDTCDR